MTAQNLKISEIEVNKGQVPGLPKNPRFIKDERFKALVKSIEDAPEMLNLRELLVYPHNGKYVVIGGNMRLRACKELGYKEVPCKILDADIDVAKLREYTIKDNNAFGSTDWDLIANEWECSELEEWGVDFFWEKENASDAENHKDATESDNPYTKNIHAPQYEIKGEKFEVEELYDEGKTEALIREIEKSQVPIEIKSFLKKAAQRHTVFNYAKIAEYYAQSSKEVQSLFEASALVIIDFNDAIKNGFTRLSNTIEEMKDEQE